MHAYLFAYLAGALTTLNPCVLPMVPFVLATALQSGRLGPIALIAGLATTFTGAGVAVAALGPALGISLEGIRIATAIVVLLFGLTLLVPSGSAAFATTLGPIANGANGLIDRLAFDGLRGQFITGALMGLVWSPCSGPTLFGAISLAAAGGSLGQAALTMLVFSLGAGTVLALLSYGAREVIQRRKAAMIGLASRARIVTGVLFVAIAVMILSGADKWIETQLVDLMPEWLLVLTTLY